MTQMFTVAECALIMKPVPATKSKSNNGKALFILVPRYPHPCLKSLRVLLANLMSQRHVS